MVTHHDQQASENRNPAKHGRELFLNTTLLLYLDLQIMVTFSTPTTVPLLFGLTYYIFDFGLLKKAFLTAITMTHLALFLPLQVLVQALFLQKTVLFMPVLYIIFGMPVDILIIIAFYSWGMTWFFRSAQEL